MEEITIKKTEYDRLKKDSAWLACLEAAGVDNWEGMEVACELHREDTPDE